MKKLNKLKYIILISMITFLGINNIHAASERCAVCGPDSLPIPIGIPNFISKLILLVQIATPIIIIIMALVNYFKAVMSGDDKVINETNSSFIRSLIAGVSIFLIVTIVKFVFSLAGPDTESSLNCVSCFLNGKDECKIEACPERGTVPENSYFCYQCSSDNFDKVWSQTTPTNSSCKDGYVLTDLNKSDCTSSCYQCNNDGTKYIWTNSNPGKTDSCPGGYHGVNIEKNECRNKNYKYACYQCNSDSTIYSWKTNTDADESCNSGYHSTNIETETECHN